MSIFDDLCKLYWEEREKDIEYIRNAAYSAQQFTDSFQKYIDAPEPVDSYDGQKELRYVEVVYVDNEWNEIGRNYRDINNLYVDRNGFLRFDILVTLEKAKNVQPKINIVIHCGIRPLPFKEGEYKIFINDPGDSEIYKEFEWTANSPAHLGPEQYIVDMIVKTLTHSPRTAVPLQS